jgi:hypothetical protein
MSTDNKNKEKLSKTVSVDTSSETVLSKAKANSKTSVVSKNELKFKSSKSSESTASTRSSESRSSESSESSESESESESSESTASRSGSELSELSGLKTKKNKGDSDKSTVLELSGDFIKTNCVNTNSPLANSAFKILGESSNIIKNSSFGKLSGMGEEDKSSNSSKLDYFINDNDVIKIVGNSDNASYDKNKSSSVSQDEDIENLNILGPDILNIINFGKKKSKIIDIK